MTTPLTTPPVPAQIYLHRSCRVCKSPLEEILNLGNLRLNAFPHSVHAIDLIPQVPLILTVCKGCGLVQLDRTVPQDWLYREYWYRSGVNETMVEELRDVVREARSLVPVGPGDAVLDIGANDGTLLASYWDMAGAGPHRLAVEPALNLHVALRPHADEISAAYFPTLGPSLSAFQGRVSIITAIAMCYDLEQPLDFFTALHGLLKPGGVAIIQFQDLAAQIEARAFDNICHEHLEYYTLWSLSHLCNRSGLSIQRVNRRAINGGSLRVVLRRGEEGIAPEPSVGMQLAYEMQLGLATTDLRAGEFGLFRRFAKQVVQAQDHIRATLAPALDEGRVVDVYGASTKGNILLQILGLGPDIIRQAIDRSPAKWGMHTVTGIPIVGESDAQADPADLWLCPIWQFRESVLQREEWYLERGGTIVFPLPHCEIVRARMGVGGVGV